MGHEVKDLSGTRTPFLADDEYDEHVDDDVGVMYGQLTSDPWEKT